MRILVFSIYYRPDGGAAAPLFTTLCEALVHRGHMVTVITTVPHYPSGKVQAAYRGWSIIRRIENGVCVIRVPLPSVNRKTMVARAYQFATFQILATLKSLRLDFDLFIAHTSSLESWLPFMVNATIRGKPAIYSVHDIYPDVGIKLGIFTSKPIINLFTWLEKGCLSHAKIVRVLSSSFIPRIKELGVKEENIGLIYDWVEEVDSNPLPKSNSFSTKYLIENTFNIIYAGNMGAVQGLEIVLKTAEILKLEKDIRFVFVGDGTEKSVLIDRTKQLGLSNVIFIPYQARDKMPEVWASGDAALVMLRKGTGFGALPSKTYSLMASGRPLLVSVDEDSETWKLVKRAEAGLCVPPEDPVQLAEAILSLKEDKPLLDQMGRNGREWAILHHSPQMAAQKFEDIFYSILPGRSNNN